MFYRPTFPSLESRSLCLFPKRKFASLTFLFFFSIWSLPLCVLCVEQTTCSVVRRQRVLALAKEWALSCHVSAGLLQQRSSWCFCCIKDHILVVCSGVSSVCRYSLAPLDQTVFSLQEPEHVCSLICDADTDVGYTERSQYLWSGSNCWNWSVKSSQQRWLMYCRP